ncbi:MAG TPA: nucleotide pyrophosphohydrolase [Candidatus Saccharimonadales bacterium]|nr:nucleotide pyrophosphohydrolase [Candidatus Saccharimonadales bacterium]
MTDLDKLQKMIVDFRDERDWKQFHNPKDTAISLVLEATEFLEHFQWKNEQEIKDHLRKAGPEVADELADVLYWVLLIANDLSFDLGEALEKKMAKNRAKYPVEKAKGKHTKYTEL